MIYTVQRGHTRDKARQRIYGMAESHRRVFSGNAYFSFVNIRFMNNIIDQYAYQTFDYLLYMGYYDYVMILPIIFVRQLE